MITARNMIKYLNMRQSPPLLFTGFLTGLLVSGNPNVATVADLSNWGYKESCLFNRENIV